MLIFWHWDVDKIENFWKKMRKVLENEGKVVYLQLKE